MLRTALVLFVLGLGCQNANKQEVNPPRNKLPVKIFYVKDVGMDIVYPSNLETKPAEQNIVEEDRGGSLSAVDFYLTEKDVQLFEVLFHTEKSCSKFYDAVKNSEPEGDFFDESWYSPEEFVKQKQAFQNKTGYGGFEFETIDGTEFLFKCGLASGETFGECIMFKNDIRILTTLGSLRECTDVSEQMKSLYSKMKFEKHKQE